MKILILLLCTLPVLAFRHADVPVPKSNPGAKLEHYVNHYYGEESNKKSADAIFHFVSKLERKELNRKSTDFIRFLFTATRQKFLRHYQDYAGFSEMAVNGKYNCLTGTALYALLLDHFNIEYQIIETNYHIFLIAVTAEGQILIESTDPSHGFVTNPQEIKKRITLYKQNKVLETEDRRRYYRYNFTLFNQVNLDQLEGLLHYNHAIAAFNQQNLPLAINHLSKALDLYNSPRIVEFSSILWLAVRESSIDDSSKERCFKLLEAMRRKQSPLMANQTR
jgi:hypothetical protein